MVGFINMYPSITITFFSLIYTPKAKYSEKNMHILTQINTLKTNKHGHTNTDKHAQVINLVLYTQSTFTVISR